MMGNQMFFTKQNVDSKIKATPLSRQSNDMKKTQPQTNNRVPSNPPIAPNVVHQVSSNLQPAKQKVVENKRRSIG